eukprot:c18252_g1_i2.p2 GENE.c18252_g1_i2~~c18252_g1_i2.p2  ORF type:complete len:130 (-),score=14.84 c18252_g1_i2:262-651(-)
MPETEILLGRETGHNACIPCLWVWLCSCVTIQDRSLFFFCCCVPMVGAFISSSQNNKLRVQNVPHLKVQRTQGAIDHNSVFHTSQDDLVVANKRLASKRNLNAAVLKFCAEFRHANIPNITHFVWEWFW